MPLFKFSLSVWLSACRSISDSREESSLQFGSRVQKIRQRFAVLVIGRVGGNFILWIWKCSGICTMKFADKSARIHFTIIQ